LQNSDAFYALVLIAWLIATMLVNAFYQTNFQKLLWEVNAQLPPQRRFSPFWWYGLKHRRLFKEYRALFPSGPLLHKLRMLEITHSITFGLLLSAFGSYVFGIIVAVGGAVTTWFVYR
jgi:hypothetical protein